MPSLRLGTRASALAQWQADWVATQLRQRDVEVSLVPITTTGDRRQGTIQAIGGQGVFTKEIQRALLDSRIDLAVHSLKDLPTRNLPSPSGRGAGGEGCTVSGLVLAAVPQRGPAGDVLVSPNYASWKKLPPHARVGTSSLRRRAQLLHVRGDLEMKDIRGNVETRLQKLHRGDFDALVLAEAGLRRLGLDQHITQVLPSQLMLPAVGQGALALETRGDDEKTRELAAMLDDPPTHAAVLAERAMLAALHGGCFAPIAALGRVEQGQLTLAGRVIGADGLKLIEAAGTVPIFVSAKMGLSPLTFGRGTEDEGSTLPSPFGRGAGGEGDVASIALRLGQRVADSLLAQGAAELITAARA